MKRGPLGTDPAKPQTVDISDVPFSLPLVVFLTEERLLSAVSPLGDMVGDARSRANGSSSTGGSWGVANQNANTNVLLWPS